MYWRNNRTAADLVRRNIPQSLPATNLTSPRRVFLQTSCCLVRSSRELYLRVHKKIINLICMIFCCILSNYFIFLQSLQKWKRVYEQEMQPSWINYFTAIGWKIPCGPTEILSHSRSIEVWNFSQYCFIFYTIHTPVCCVGCLMIANICTYISLYISNTAILVNKKLVCISQHQLVNTCELHLVNCAKCAYDPYKHASDWSVVADLKSLLNFKVIFLTV